MRILVLRRRTCILAIRVLVDVWRRRARQATVWAAVQAGKGHLGVGRAVGGMVVQAEAVERAVVEEMEVAMEEAMVAVAAVEVVDGSFVPLYEWCNEALI